VAELDGAVVGFHSHRVEGKGLAGQISGVRLSAQGKGIGKALIAGSIVYGREQRLEWIQESPHINHPNMNRLIADIGYRMEATFYTFHKWFDKA
jgi:GNAT superfamily N-acetyltransferase